MKNKKKPLVQIFDRDVPEYTRKQAIQLISLNIRAYNKYLSNELIKEMSDKDLLIHTHPLSRDYFEKLLLKTKVQDPLQQVK